MLRRFLEILFIAAMLISCSPQEIEMSEIEAEDWTLRKVGYSMPDTLISGSSYLSIYSGIYSRKKNMTHDLTVTVSVRNTSRDTLYLDNASFYSTEGNLIKNYFDFPCFLGPFETVEIVIEEDDKSGGTGGNFLFHWMMEPGSTEPLFEAVMISTSGQQGLSFTTQGIRLN